MITIELEYNVKLKMYNIKVIRKAFEITLLLSSTVFTLCFLDSKQRFTQTFRVS